MVMYGLLYHEVAIGLSGRVQGTRMLHQVLIADRLSH